MVYIQVWYAFQYCIFASMQVFLYAYMNEHLNARMNIWKHTSPLACKYKMYTIQHMCIHILLTYIPYICTILAHLHTCLHTIHPSISYMHFCILTYSAEHAHYLLVPTEHALIPWVSTEHVQTLLLPREHAHFSQVFTEHNLSLLVPSEHVHTLLVHAEHAHTQFLSTDHPISLLIATDHSW